MNKSPRERLRKGLVYRIAATTWPRPATRRRRGQTVEQESGNDNAVERCSDHQAACGQTSRASQYLAAVTPPIGTRSPHQTGKQLASSHQDHSLRKMARVTVVGIGPGPLSWLTMEAERELRLANKIFFRTGSYPAFHWLRELGKQVICFDVLYTLPWSDPEKNTSSWRKSS